MSTKELRVIFPSRLQELRVLDSEEGKPTRIRGLAVPYGELSHDLGGFRERFVKGAFDEWLRSRDTIVDIEHDPFHKLARTKRNTARVWEEDNGLYVEFDVPDTTRGRDTVEEVRRGDLDGMSIQFRALEDTWIEDAKPVIREVTRSTLPAITLTGNPAYPQTTDQVELRSLDYKNWKENSSPAALAQVDADLRDVDLELVELELELDEVTN